jgi:hypothetical protein
LPLLLQLLVLLLETKRLGHRRRRRSLGARNSVSVRPKRGREIRTRALEFGGKLSTLGRLSEESSSGSFTFVNGKGLIRA